MTPISSVELHPQTTSTIGKVHIREGQFVKAGQVMFTLDDRSERANVDKAAAQTARDRAALADLERQYKRSQELFDQKFIARSALDTLRSQVEAARAGASALPPPRCRAEPGRPPATAPSARRWRAG